MNGLRGAVFRAGVLLAVGAIIAAAPAHAQVAKAPGFKVGEGRLHPYFEFDARFDSLAGRFALNVDSPEIVFHFRPRLVFALDTPSTAVNFNGAAEYLWFTGLLSPGTQALSEFPKGLRANVGLDTKFNRDGAVEIQIGDALSHTDRPTNPNFAFGVLSLFNNLYLAAPIHPGGRALEITPKVAWTVEFFSPLLTGLVSGCPAGDPTCDPVTAPSSNYSNLNFGLNARWKFLPKTAAVIDVNGDWRTYFASPGTNDRGLFRAQAGLAGLITPRIAVTLLAGYGGDFTTTTQFHTFIGTAEFSYQVSEQTRIAVGYARNNMAVPLFGLALNDRGYLRGGIGLIGGRLLINAQVTLDHFAYTAAPDRNGFIVGASIGPSFTVTSWFDVSASYNLSVRAAETAPQLNFARHEAVLRLVFHY